MGYIQGFLVLILYFSTEIDGKRHWQIVPEKEPQPINIMDPVEPEPFVTYNDEKHRMTVIQDADIGACFLTNYDPEWKLSNEEKHRISRSSVAQRIRSPIDFVKLKAKVGDIISSMCKHRALYWMTRPEMPPKPQVHIVQHGHAPVRLHPQPVPFHIPSPLHHRGPGNMPPHIPHPHKIPGNIHSHFPHPHHGKSALKEPAPVPHKPIKPETDSEPHNIAPGDDVADHYIIPPKKH